MLIAHSNRNSNFLKCRDGLRASGSKVTFIPSGKFGLQL